MCYLFYESTNGRIHMIMQVEGRLENLLCLPCSIKNVAQDTLQAQTIFFYL